MGIFQKLFKQTFIYGMATVLPRMLSFLLVPLYTNQLPTEEYGKVSIIFSYFVLFNVILAYGMETAFFRFFNKESDKEKVVSTSAISIATSSFVFLVIAFLLKEQISVWIDIKLEYINLVIWILLLDALVIIPFSWLRAKERPMRYAVIKIANVAINFGLNIFFLLYLKELSFHFSSLDTIYKENYEISYIFISNLIASGFTLLMLLPFYTKIKYRFDRILWKKMMKYAMPILIAGIAYSINETFDRILLDHLLPENVAEHMVGVYSACYKLALFMTLFATAFRLGIEPFFFNYAENKSAPETYARITKYFVILGSFIFLFVIVFVHILKIAFLRDASYWEAVKIVPFILLANFCLGVYHNLSVWYKVTDRTRFGAYISVFGAIVTLLLNFLLIPEYTYVGSAIATLAAYGSMMILSWYLGRKYYPIPYDLKKIGMYLALSIGFSIISFYIFDSNYMISIPLLLVFLVILYASEKKELKQLLKR
ncbi:polysaccharide biosynthesis protein [Aquimarina sp. BL5]|uniref:oligosaccharide flippase family protein n=1 Tax=Aquimarina sp. BL5 TaxID=1714860 RepID=UPI000E526533|nr:oligosaccharide flippase family protein [Aquimarina sp. BL5]AXT51916.1 polysaccharide biosynthesis protein [Aquimarina sp. BL5]RKN02962.1 polysaccharide biosynthesis protein [Aquimarina sp. BL5]